MSTNISSRKSEDQQAKYLSGAKSIKWKGSAVTFENVTYDVKSNSDTDKGTVRLLHGASGRLLPGTVTCLMGPSGSGKTTLLDILAGRKTLGTIKGDILFGGRPPTPAYLKRYTGYVEQFDTLLPMLSPREMLRYTAELKLPSSVSRDEKFRRVEILIKRLKLVDCADVLIGNMAARGISGGQAKRVNIGIALIAEPRVLFLDEPTSGLDSHTAREVMDAITTVARSGVTVVATIHSPSAAVFRSFDSLIMLLRGRMIYVGDNGDAPLSQIEAACAWDHETLSAGDNPAEWLLEVTTESNGHPERVEALADACAKSPHTATEVAEIRKLAAAEKEAHAGHKGLVGTAPATVVGIIPAIATLLRYRSSRNLRDGEFLGARLGDKILIPFIIATLYYGQGDTIARSGFSGAPSASLTNTAAVLFMWSIGPGFAASSYVPSIILERDIYVRERADGLYSPLTYLLAKVIEEFAVLLPAGLLSSALIYYVVELQGSFGIFLAVYYLSVFCGITLAYLIASLAPNVDTANAALPAYVVTLLFFTGFLIRSDDIPTGWKWYKVVNFLSYAWSGHMLNQFGPYTGEPTANDPAFLDGQTMLEYWGQAGKSTSNQVAYIFCFCAFFFTCAWAALKYKRFQRR